MSKIGLTKYIGQHSRNTTYKLHLIKIIGILDVFQHVKELDRLILENSV